MDPDHTTHTPGGHFGSKRGAAPAWSSGRAGDPARRPAYRRLLLLTNALWAIVLFALAGGLLILSGSTRTKTLDLSQYHLVFDEGFAHLNVSAYGPGTRWIAHTPWGGDFGDAAFADPKPGFPFGFVNGVGRIEMRKSPDGHWQSGLLSSVDPQGNGFALQYGYFEMRAKLPAGPGVWPAFWLDSMTPKESSDPSIEIDVFEQYGKFPDAFNSTATVWPKGAGEKSRSEMKIVRVPYGTLSERFHDYGVEVGPEWIVFYFDRVETWRVRTPPEHKHGLMILADLGLGSGWPIDKTPSPSFMYITYIRAYAPG